MIKKKIADKVAAMAGMMERRINRGIILATNASKKEVVVEIEIEEMKSEATFKEVKEVVDSACKYLQVWYETEGEWDWKSELVSSFTVRVTLS